MGIDDKKALWPSAEELKNAREDLRIRLMHEELECALQFESVNRLITDLRVDTESFRKLWVQPLLTAGATLGSRIGVHRPIPFPAKLKLVMIFGRS